MRLPRTVLKLHGALKHVLHVLDVVCRSEIPRLHPLSDVPADAQGTAVAFVNERCTYLHDLYDILVEAHSVRSWASRILDACLGRTSYSTSLGLVAT